MTIKKVLNQLDLEPDKEDIENLSSFLSSFSADLKKIFKKQNIKAELFVGGSFPKGTLTRKSIYDVDIFIRFNWKYEDLSSYLEKALSIIKGYKIKLIHGSRDYFQVSKDKYLLEIIPVTKIKRPAQARNVTDLSYFHVNYLKKRINPELAKQIRLAKTFCHSQKVYGAESYIQGFSGYALECLIIHYKTFHNMVKKLAKVQERIVIDPEKHFKNKDSIFLEINESKLHSPIVLIDPTFKERNALAALSPETFKKFQKAASSFLKNPSLSYFIPKPISPIELKLNAKKRKAEFINLTMKTNKQKGDIAGTKLKKFANFLQTELSKFYNIIEKEFEYNDKQTANLYLIVKPKPLLTKIGPPLHMKKHVKAFQKEHTSTFKKNKFIHARIKPPKKAKSYLDSWLAGNFKVLKEMSITKLEI